MRWLVFGSNGWIGGQVIEAIRTGRPGDEIATSGSVRADDIGSVENLLRESRPDRVLCLVGRTHGPGHSTIDYLELPGKLDENVRDNLFAPAALAVACERFGAHLTYLGTGCIFSYDDLHPEGFQESDRPNFRGSSYSIVKGYTDRFMKLFDETALNVRIRMPINAERNVRNFITKITTYEKVCSVHNSMTVLPELLPIMIDMASKKITGTVNLTNPGAISHDEILSMYKEIVDPSFAWKNFSIEEQDAILLSKRSNNLLDTSRLRSLYPSVRPIGEAVRDALEAMARDDKYSQCKIIRNERDAV